MKTSDQLLARPENISITKFGKTVRIDITLIDEYEASVVFHDIADGLKRGCSLTLHAGGDQK